jgi:predicted dehydrogenase
MAKIGRFLNRRAFLRKTALAGVGLAAATASVPALGAGDANEKLVVAVMGLGRGMGHVSALLKIPNVEIAHLCDVDSSRMESARKEVERSLNKAPPGTQDFRRILDDKSVDAIFIATPNHWHAPAAILACAAGKHVYVEKPGSQNPAEGEMMVAAARKHRRVVQMGNQRRTWPSIREAIEKVRTGTIGRVTLARSWYTSLRPSIGRGTQAAPPSQLDYSLWQGPAPERPYKTNLIHYNWHWHWHWGNGELGNNGVHALDVVRWGLGVDYPTLVSYVGGRYAFDDDQETPDTGVASFHFGDKGATWEGSSCHSRRGEDLPFVAFYGEGGVLAITDPGYKIFDAKGKVVDEKPGEGGDVGHIANFLGAVRGKEKPNSEIEEAQKSTLLCHLGNISYRLGRTIRFDPQARKIVGEREAEPYWSREYRAGWKVGET